MSNASKPSAENSGNFFLEEPERWEALGIDWQDWNATVEKILQRQAAAGTREAKWGQRTKLRFLDFPREFPVSAVPCSTD